MTRRGRGDYMKDWIMSGRRIEIDLPEEMFGELMRVAETIGLASPSEAALVGLAEWIFQRRAELDNRDPSQRYFVNEALDQLAEGGKGPAERKD